MKNYIFYLIILVFSFCGCIKELNFVKTGLLLTQDKIKKINVGITKKDDVLKNFGKPLNDLNLNGTETFFYKDGNLKALWIKFDENGFVKDFAFSKK